MAIMCFPLNDIEYLAEDMQAYTSTRTTGIFSSDNDFVVRANNGMSIVISPGQLWASLERFQGVAVYEKEETYLTLDYADGTLSRIDRIVVRVDRVANKPLIVIKKGVFAINPVPVEIIRNKEMYEIAICDITIPKGVLQITQANINNAIKLDESLCGIMRDGVTGIPTQQLYDEWWKWFTELKINAEEKAQLFIDWMNTFKSLNEAEFKKWEIDFKKKYEDKFDEFYSIFVDDKNNIVDGWFDGFKDNWEQTLKELSDVDAYNLFKKIEDHEKTTVIEENGIHGTRVLNDIFQFFNGTEWKKVGTEGVLATQTVNFKKVNDVPTSYPTGVTLFFANGGVDPDYQFAGLTYSGVLTFKSFTSSGSILQIIIPYNSNADTIFYRTSLYNQDTWRDVFTITTDDKLTNSSISPVFANSLRSDYFINQQFVGIISTQNRTTTLCYLYLNNIGESSVIDFEVTIYSPFNYGNKPGIITKKFGAYLVTKIIAGNTSYYTHANFPAAGIGSSIGGIKNGLNNTVNIGEIEHHVDGNYRIPIYVAGSESGNEGYYVTVQNFYSTTKNLSNINFGLGTSVATDYKIITARERWFHVEDKLINQFLLGKNILNNSSLNYETNMILLGSNSYNNFIGGDLILIGNSTCNYSGGFAERERMTALSSIIIGSRTANLTMNSGSGTTGISSCVIIGNDAVPYSDSRFLISSSVFIGDRAAYQGGYAYSVLIGANTDTENDNSIAIGYKAGTSSQSVAIGSNVKVYDSNTVAIGYFINSSTDNTIILGNNKITSLRCNVQTISSLSDIRIKEDIMPADIEMCLQTVLDLPVTRYKYKDFVGKKLDKHVTGWLADDVEKVFPKAVQTSDEDFYYYDKNEEPIVDHYEIKTEKIIKKQSVIDENGNEVEIEVEEVEEVKEPVYKKESLKNVKNITMTEAVPTLWGSVQALEKRNKILEEKLLKMEKQIARLEKI